MDEHPRLVPIHRALIRPQLIMGCERFLFLMLCMVVTLLGWQGGIVVGNFRNAVLAIPLFFVGRAVLVYMAKIDPYMSHVYRRSVLYRAEYSANSEANVNNRVIPHTW